MSDNGTKKDLAIAFAGIISTLAKNCPETSSTALVGAGMIAGIVMAESDVRLMGRVIAEAIPSDQLKASRASAKSIVKMFRAIERVGKVITALPQ